MHASPPIRLLARFTELVRAIVSRLRTALWRTAIRVTTAPPTARERGQSTAEYALVLLGAAAVALAFMAWAGKTGRIGDLFDSVINSVIGRV